MASTFSARCCFLAYKACVAAILDFAVGKSTKWKQWMKVLVNKL
jgi:hypothetical protein